MKHNVKTIVTPHATASIEPKKYIDMKKPRTFSNALNVPIQNIVLVSFATWKKEPEILFAACIPIDKLRIWKHGIALYHWSAKNNIMISFEEKKANIDKGKHIIFIIDNILYK